VILGDRADQVIVLPLNFMSKEKAIVFKAGMTKAQIAALWKKVFAGRARRSTKPLLDIWQFCGVIKLKEDPMVIQQRMRDEWD